MRILYYWVSIPTLESRRIRKNLVLLGCSRIDEINGAITEVFTGMMLLEQRAESRIAVKTGKATPDNLAAVIDQRPDAAVADQTQVNGTDHRIETSSLTKNDRDP